MTDWDVARWPNFRPEEVACPCCGEVYVDPDAMDALQRLRDALARPVAISSGHRCAAHNKAVGGAPTSKHLALAFDVPVSGDWREFHDAAIRAGFTGIGYAETYIHLDTRPAPARWHYSDNAKTLWAGKLFGSRNT